ncbi:uncharacterized protein TRAVEDRAFT_56242 [Trametes versicolor FP-101664 SS1]|uniref:uncharacterized protein n=1 Tax=Trametes versicolor (strain FP-101664) TaxID=717944 RepID=UPI0004623235|nr:uncharacterized protein TRAVEDRAFT_56242 [Trametes versicolor FP-101664 SS1]EIW63066.1 hypothetical protein TRAVEDRAFT_56242 [Trametes versicolor FP-101664 SS1]
MFSKLAVLVLAAVPAAFSVSVRQTAPFVNPVDGGGSMLIDAGNGLGEPLNVIISGQSSKSVLNEDGIINYARAIGFSTECFGIHLGNPFSANLGDGHGAVNQTVELRQDFGDSDVGTCLESLIGGNHFRVYFQNGPSADTGAAFLAVSAEKPATDNHDIEPDGYDVGRNGLVNAAVGTTDFGGITYNTVAENITGLLPVGSNGVNHGIAIDGIVTVLTVTIE